MKIAVIGYSGSGKSTLAEMLGRKYGVEPLHLDSVFWLPGWVERDREEMRRLVADYLDTHSSWVIDGDYSKCCWERRMAEADRIIFLDFPRLTCLWRAWKRYRTYRGRTRADMGAGCPEKMDGTFLWWLLWRGRTRARRERFLGICARYPGKTVRIRNQRGLDAFGKECGL